MYNIYSKPAIINSIKCGQIYIANPAAQIIQTCKELQGDKQKTKLHSIGTFTTRPVLVVREPEPWDKYTTVSVCCSTTREVPSVSFTAADNVYNFKLHDVRTVCVSSLVRLIGGLSPSATAMCQAILATFYGVNEFNVKSRLDDLKRFTYGIDEAHINDVRNIYEALYCKYAYCVDKSYEPDWFPTNKTQDNYNQIQIFGFYGSTAEELPPKITASDAGLVPETAPEPEVEPAKTPLRSSVASAKTISIKSTKAAVEKTVKPKATHSGTCVRQKSVSLKFSPSPSTRAWRSITPTAKPIDQHMAESMYLSGYVTCESMARKFGVSRYAFDKRAKANLLARSGSIAEATWSTDSECYSQFRTWWRNNDLETKGYFKRGDVEAMFPLIRDSMVPYPLTEAKVPCSIRASFYIDKLTLPEIIEVVPLMATTKIAELTGAQIAAAKEIKEYCTNCRDVHLRMTDHVWDDKIAKVRLYITPNNMTTMPAWLREEFMSIPIDKLRDYCKSLPGWSRYDFDDIYGKAVKAFAKTLAQKA